MAGPIVVAIKGDNDDVNAALRQTETLTSRAGSNFRRLAVPVTAAFAAMAVGAYSTITAASDVSESLSKNEQVFGKQAKAIERFSARADTALGQTQVAALDAAATFGLIGEKAGLNDRETAKFSRTFTTLASDLASFNNTTPEEAIEAIGAAMRGESEPIRKYGVLLDDATLRARALKMGLIETTKDALTPQQKALAASQEILAQTTKAQGDFERTSGGAANQSRIFTAQVQNLRAGIGQGLLPVFTELVTFGNKSVVPFLADLADEYAPKVADALADLPGLLDDLKSGGGDGSQYGEIADNLAKVGPAVAELLDALPSLNDTLSVTSEVVGFAADHTDLLAKALPFLVAGYVAVQAAQVAANTAQVLSVPTKFAEIAVNRQLVASNRALMASRADLTTATLAGTAADQASVTTSAQAAGGISKLGAAARLAAGAAGIGLLTDGLTRSNSAVGTLETTLGGAAAGFAVGGPIGGAIGGLAGLFLAVNKKAHNAAQEAEDAYHKLADVDPVEEAKASLADLRDTLDEVTGAYTGATRAAVLHKLEEAGLIEAAAKYGISSRQVVNAAMGERSAMSGLAPVIKSYKEQIADLTAKEEALTAQLQSGKLRPGTGQIEAVQEQRLELEKQRAALEGNLAELKQMPRSLRAMGAETRQTAAATADYTGKLKGIPPRVRTAIEQTGLEPSARAIADLAERYDLTPKQVKTLIAATGADTSAAEVQRLIDRVNDLHDKTITVRVNQIGGVTSSHGGHSQEEVGRRSGDAITDAIVAAFAAGSEGVQTALDRIDALVEQDLDRTVKRIDRKHAEIAKNLRKRLDGKELRKALEQNEKDRERAENRAERAAERAHRRMMAHTKELRAELRASGKAQDAANKAYADGVEQLQRLKDEAQAYSDAVRDAVVASGSLSQLGQGDGFSSVEDLIAKRTAAAERAEEFATLINQLAAAGLNSSDLQDLIAQGVEGGMGTAQALLAGGPEVIATMNTLAARLQATGTQLGDDTAATLYGAGIQAAQGLVDGLAANADVLAKQATRLARALVKAVKKALGIESPSRVFKDLGKQTVLGLGIGLDEVYVRRQGHQLATNLEKGFGSPALAAYLDSRSTAQRQTIEVRLTAQQLDALSRGRAIQADLDLYHAEGGRPRS